MTDTEYLKTLYAFGVKLYELQVGFTALFNCCRQAAVFSDASFDVHRVEAEQAPEMVRLREFLAKLSASKAEADLRDKMKGREGPIQ